jgi:hypothetical protein
VAEDWILNEEADEKQKGYEVVSLIEKNNEYKVNGG